MKWVAFALDVLGLALLSFSAWLWLPEVGYAAAGLSLLLLSLVLDRGVVGR